MSMEMIVDVVRKQFEASDEALVAWKPKNSTGPENAVYAEDAIVVFLDRPRVMRRAVERIYQAQQAGRIAHPLPLWHQVFALFERALRQAQPLRELIGSVQEAGARVERAEEFEQAVRELEELRNDFQKTFPVTTEAEIAEDREAIARGEYQDADEAFAQIAGVDGEAWQKRVADYERGPRN